jgi:alkylation response protein AidB-like acyl-CoA dehydrogenase
MTTEFDIAVSEPGIEASAGLDELLAKRFGGRPIVEYAYGEPTEWDELADGGWDLLAASEDDGGAGLPLRDLIAVAMVVGRWLPPLPILETAMVKRWSSAAREGGPASVAITTESGRVLVPFGASPGIAVLRANGAVEAAGSVTADDYAPSLRMAEPASGGASELTPEQARELAIVWGAEAAGCAERMLDIAIAYVKQREQFGQPVGKFQAVKHHLADALKFAQESESAVIWAAADAPKVGPALEVAFDSALRAAEIGVQAHGGMGFTWELGLHVYLRQIVSLRQLALAAAAIADRDR